jgi:hypothetical protein
LAHKNAVANKAWVRDRFGELTDELEETAPIEDADTLADELALLMEGVYVSAQALGAVGPATRARVLADVPLTTPER